VHNGAQKGTRLRKGAKNALKDAQKSIERHNNAQKTIRMRKDAAKGNEMHYITATTKQ